MKLMPNTKREGLKASTDVVPRNSGATIQEPIALDEVQGHLEQLRGVSAMAAKLFTLLGEHIIAVSATVPVQIGRKTVQELKNQARAHRDGLATAFDPLRDQIEELKNGFWERNREVIETAAREYVNRKIKERVTTEVEKAVGRYRKYVAGNEQNNEMLKATVNVSCARTENSLLRSAHLNELVTWTGGEGPTMSFEDLMLANDSQLTLLANALSLSPDDDSQDLILNKVFRELGIQYRAIPSRNSILLMPTMTNLG